MQYNLAVFSGKGIFLNDRECFAEESLATTIKQHSKEISFCPRGSMGAVYHSSTIPSSSLTIRHAVHVLFIAWQLSQARYRAGVVDSR